MPPRKKKVSGSIYQIKIELLYAPYPLWRRIVTWGDLNLSMFIHQILAVMGWQNCHMHALRIGKKEYQGFSDGMDPFSMFDSPQQPKTLNADNFLLCDVMKKGDKAYFEYDFGDGWEHKLTVEKVFTELPEGMKVPSCLDGAGACPPEDCGGIPGLENLIDIMEHPEQDPEEYNDLLDWLGGEKFKKDEFNASSVSERIKLFQ